VIATLLLAAALSQDSPKPRVPDAALFDELIRKTNELQAFTAEYRVKVPGSDDVRPIRIAFRAPDDLRVEMEGSAVFQIHAGVLEMRAAPPGGSASTASVPIAELMSERRKRLTEVLHAEIPASKADWVADAACNLVLEMRVTTHEAAEKEDFTFGVKHACPRTALLGWLPDWRERSDLRYDGDGRIAATTAGGAELRLSAKTGFLESIVKEKNGDRMTFELASLDLAPKLDASRFALPEAAKDAVDATPFLAMQLNESISGDLRRDVLRNIVRHVADKTFEWPGGRAHARKVLEALHADAFAAENEFVIADIRKRVERIGVAFRDRYASLAKSDAAGRGELDTNVEEQRTKLLDVLKKRLDKRLSGLELDERLTSDAALRSDLSALEKEAVETAFARTLHDPIVEAFDEQVAKAKAGG
jgi:hypothetical protein